MHSRLALFLLSALASTGAACHHEKPSAVGSGSRTLLELASDAPDQLATVAPFRFTSSEGATVTEKDLQGRVWIVDFFFTTCSGPCPVITGHMRKLQDELAGSTVQLVSISVDPETDTPAALHDYAERVGADRARWTFLTGDERATHDLIRSSFALQVERASDPQLGFQISHATRLVVVDGRGHVRGYYPGETDAGRALARERALWLSLHPDS